jgi:iron(III) transport system substrate-binding protein
MPNPTANAGFKLLGLLLLAAVPLGAVALRSGDGGADVPSVVLYTAHNQEIVDRLIPRFEAETGITAEVVKLGSGDLIQRVEAEQGAPRCDVIWSIAGEQLEAHHALLEPYEPKDAAALDPTFRVGTNWLPYTGIVVTFVVNTDQAKDHPPITAWKDLADPSLKGLVASARADKSGSAFMQLAAVLKVHGDEAGWPLYEQLLTNFHLVGSSSAVPRLVNDGEVVAGVTLEDNAQRYVAGGGPVEIVYPADGTLASPDGIALVKGAPHAEQAKVFIDWALSKATQDLLVETLGRRPVRTDGGTPPGLPPLSEIKTLPYDFGWSASHKDAWVERWRGLAEAKGSD